MSVENEPAFPVPDCAAFQYHGMTLRDWLAGQAISGVICQCARDSRGRFPDEPETIEGMFARKAYAIADAMLAERARK